MAGPSRTFSLRAHLLLLVIGTLVPALLIAAVLVRRVFNDNRKAAEQRLLETARAAAAGVDAELGGTIRALQGLGESGRLAEGEIPGFYDQARRLLKTQPTWSAVSLSTPDGQQIVNTNRPLSEPLPKIADHDSWERAISTKSPVIGNLLRGQITQQLGFIVRVPILREGRVAYVLTAWITSDKFAGVLKRQAPLADEWVRGVVDATGVIVARSRDPDRFVGQKDTPAFLRVNGSDEAVYRDLSLEGTAVYGAFSRAPMSRWIAGIGVPASTVDARFRESMATLAAVALLLLAVGGGGAYFVSRRISRDLTKAAAEAETIAGGRNPSRVGSRVTELQRMSDALAQSAALLETRQRERDEQVTRANAARAEAEAADRAKDQFLAMLGHELRNPLAPALTAIHLMKMRHGADTTRERDIVERQIRHMARLVDDLLDVSRLRRGSIELRRERFELADAVARALEMTSAVFSEKQHRLDVEVPPDLEIHADRVRMAQVLSNLLSNAAKYSEPGAHILLRVHKENDHVVIECRDTGIGMAADLVPRVFDIFVQGQRGLDRRQGGLGLGLAVARTLVELHGGTIEALSAGSGQGSTFIVRLPLAMPPLASPGIAQEPSIVATPQPRIGRVMVVDDNRDALDMLVEALTAAGVEAFGTEAPLDALDLAAERHPQVAVLDIGLPQMDGFELARVLRSRDRSGGLRLIALTGYGQAQDVAAAKAAGFDAFFTKPVEVHLLIAALEMPTASSRLNGAAGLARPESV
jgi:signal transduction histidine kinase/ActR/RegA family two-component response regulator